jgi:ribonucleotide reductase alpha subunit
LPIRRGGAISVGVSLTAVTLREIERVFEILDRIGLSREAVVIPLKPAHPGGIRVLDAGKNKGKVEITVESETSLDDWLPQLETMLREAMGGEPES